MPDRKLLGLSLMHLAVLVAFALPYFINLGVSSLWDTNEAFYAETPREMLQTGNFLAPKFNSEPRAQKPPLSYWPIVLSYKLFGIREFSVRLPGALAAAGLLFYVYLTGQILISERAALIAAAVTASTMRIMFLARKFPIDILLLFFLAGSAYYLVRGIVRNSTGSWLLAYAFSGLGFLTKGPIAVLIPFGACLIWAISSRSISIRQMRLVPGAVVFSGLVLPWYVLIYLDSGWEYITPFLFRDNFGRFAREGFGPGRGPFYYMGVYLADFFPWSVLSVAALGYLWRVRRFVRPLRTLAWAFPLIWSLLVFAIFSISGNKQEYYIAPMYPMMAVVLAAVLDRNLIPAGAAAPRMWNRIWNPVSITISALLFGGAICLPFLIRSIIPGTSAALRYGPSIVLLASAAAILLATCKRDLAKCISGLLICWWLLLAALPAFYLPAVEPFRPIRILCANLQPLLSPDDEVGYYRAAAPSMLFYLRRRIFEEWRAERMMQMFRSSKRVFCIMSESDRTYFTDQRNLDLYVLDRRPQLVSRFRDLTDEKSRKARELVLISNRPAGSGSYADSPEAP